MRLEQLLSSILRLVSAFLGKSQDDIVRQASEENSSNERFCLANVNFYVR